MTHTWCCYKQNRNKRCYTYQALIHFKFSSLTLAIVPILNSCMLSVSTACGELIYWLMIPHMGGPYVLDSHQIGGICIRSRVLTAMLRDAVGVQSCKAVHGNPMQNRTNQCTKSSCRTHNTLICKGMGMRHKHLLVPCYQATQADLNRHCRVP